MPYTLSVPGRSTLWVPAFYRGPIRPGPTLALVIHMAEGGGTVGYLSRANPHQVSVHFVIDRAGNLFQMLDLMELSRSVRVTSIRTTNDPTFTSPGTGRVTYGWRAALDALDGWAYNPNNAVLSVECEGFAAVGPNLAQRRTLILLKRALEAHFHRPLANLGHRDFARYKACPGRLIPWRNLGGHYPSNR